MEPLLLSESKSNGVKEEDPNWKNDSFQDTQLKKREFLKEALREWVLNEQWQERERERERTKKVWREFSRETKQTKPPKCSESLRIYPRDLRKKKMQKQKLLSDDTTASLVLFNHFYYFGRCNYWITNLYNILKIFKWFAF